MQQEVWSAGHRCYADNNAFIKGEPYKGTWGRSRFSMEMFMTKHVRKQKNWQQSMANTFVHPFDDLEVATGQGSIAMEIVKELPTVDTILVPVGGGGLSTGVSTLAKMLNPKIKVIGVEPAGANCLQESLKAGHPVTL